MIKRKGSDALVVFKIDVKSNLVLLKTPRRKK